MHVEPCSSHAVFQLRLQIAHLSPLAFANTLRAISAPSRTKREIGSLVRDNYASVPDYGAEDVFNFSGEHPPDTTRPFFASPGQISSGRYLREQGNTVRVRFTTTSVHSTGFRTVIVHFDDRRSDQSSLHLPKVCQEGEHL